MKRARCLEELPTDGSYAVCSADPKNCAYHFECTTVKQRTFQQWGTNQRSKWLCPNHRELKKAQEKLKGNASDNSSQYNSEGEEGGDTSRATEYDNPAVSTDIKSILKHLDTKFDRQEKIFCLKFSQLEENLKLHVSRIEELEKNNEHLEKENKELKKEIIQLWQTTENVDNEIRRKNIVIRGIPEDEGEGQEQLEEILVDIANYLQEPVDKAVDVEEIFRLPSRSTDFPRPILVKFTSRRKRDSLLVKSRSEKPKRSNIWDNEEEDGPIYLSEHLTRGAAEILRKCTALKRQGNVEAVTVKKGFIHVKPLNSPRFKIIRAIKEIEQL
uniref:Uncharacterized protein n=1 Tax=Lygus hesperus TaxID=30085 RepID=A0A146LRX8_LYGHE